jgi:DNA-binding response OmpR family regulator
MKPKILLVEDDQDLGMVLKQYLEFSDFEVNWIPNPEEIWKQKADWPISISNSWCDVAVIDGFELSKEIRKSSEIPFLFLLLKGQSIDRILGLKRRRRLYYKTLRTGRADIKNQKYTQKTTEFYKSNN